MFIAFRNRGCRGASSWSCGHRVFLRQFQVAIPTPKRGEEGCRRIWEFCPSSKRIVEDVNEVFVSMKEIVKHDGVIIPSRNNSRGKRWVAKGRDHGGKRVAGTGKNCTKELAEEVMDVMAENSQNSADLHLEKHG